MHKYCTLAHYGRAHTSVTLAQLAMPTYSQRAQAALLKCSRSCRMTDSASCACTQVNRVFNIDRAAESLDELSDGLILAHILHELDREFDPSHLEQKSGTSKYLTSKQNIQTVYKGLFRFIRRQIPELGSQVKKFDYHTIAENPDSNGISQILAVMVAAATMGPNNGKYIPRIQNSLDQDSQAEIMQILRAMQQDTATFKDNERHEETLDAVMEARDVDLLVEQNAILNHQLETAKKTLSDYITRLEYLQQSYEDLKYAKEKNDRELEVFRKATQDGANSAEAIKLLEAQIHEQMEIIARHEETIRNHDRVKSNLESEVQRLNQKSTQVDELRDQVAEWKHKAEEFEKKANTADRFKQKLEAQQGLAREVQNLLYERAELQEQLQSLISDGERSERTKKAEDELTKMITQSEQHLWDERNQKNQLLKDFTAIEYELLRLKAQRAHDERFIQELHDQLQQGGGGSSQDDIEIALSETSNLKDELKNATEEGVQPILPSAASRLRNENKIPTKTLDSKGDGASLRLELDEQRHQKDWIQHNVNDMLKKHLLTKEQASALIKSANESSQGSVAMRTQLEQSQKNFEEATKNATELRKKVADGKHDSMSAKGELTKEEIETIDELKSADSLTSKSLQAELNRLREEYSLVAEERDAQKTQLTQALLAKEKLRKELEDGKELPDTAASRQDLVTAEAAKKSFEKIEKLRARLKERKKQLEQSEQDKVDLKNRLKTAQDEGRLALQKTLEEQSIQQLRKENALIATAWYYVTSRLHSNLLVLSRRHDAPRSWLSKQRQIVKATSKR